MHQLFREQVKRQGQAIAVKSKRRTLTYNELYGISRALAEKLMAAGAAVNTLVAIVMHKGWEQVAAALAIQSAGAAYLPVDAGLPQERINRLLEIGRVRIVVSVSAVLEALPLPASLLTLAVDKLDLPEHPVPDRADLQTPEDLAYVIFTSGSTGEPKGVMINHRGAVNTILDVNRRFGITSGDTVFALSVYDIFGTLAAGGTIVLPEAEEGGDPGAWIRYLEEEKVTVWNSVPALMQMLVEYAEARQVEWSLRCVLLSGDWIPVSLPGRIRELCREAAVISLGGATETSIWSIYYRVESVDCGWKSIPYGKPLANQRFHVLKADYSPCPEWVTGELYIGGEGLAVGYWEDEEKTERSFIIHPESGERLYRTGDLGRYLPDGNIEFLGREDAQVKIQGYRIELGEIEAALQNHALVEAAVVDVRKSPDGAGQLHRYLKSILPEYMVPVSYVFIDRIPLTANGKVNRKALPDPLQERRTGGEEPAVPQGELEKSMVRIWQEVLNLRQIGVDENFFEMGGNSLSIIRAARELNKLLGREVPLVAFYTYPNIRSLAGYLGGDNKHNRDAGESGRKNRKSRAEQGSGEIAIIGMSGRFPGAGNLEEYWKNIKEGRECISRFTVEELLEAGEDRAVVHHPDYVRACGCLEGKEYFDAYFFGYSPLDAEYMEPQIRLFHEEAWHALEDAGYNPETCGGLIGVFAGGMNNPEWQINSYYGGTGMNILELIQLADSSYLSARVSCKLNLKGPSYHNQTACSTSLVNIVMACEYLAQNRCDMALAGGLAVRDRTKYGYPYTPGSILSPDGHCRPYAAEAAGTVFGEGVGVVLLKRLEEAVEAGDNILAVIKGYGTNNDGSRKAGFSAPSVSGQAELIRGVLEQAGVKPESIGYVEGHGTGTPMGDPVEVEALKMAFNTEERGYCALGSVKVNVGHLNSAAGVAGLIKTVLVLKNRQLPPAVNIGEVNPLLEIEKSPFYINRELKEWERGSNPLRAGVSSFGIGGTNAHVILEEALEPAEGGRRREYEIINLSAKTGSALKRMKENLLRYAEEKREVNLSDMACTLNVGRKHFRHRYSAAVRSREELIRSLGDEKRAKRSSGRAGTEERQLVFLFPCQGSQYAGMGQGLYEQEPEFREEAERCFGILKEERGVDMKSLIFGGEGDINRSGVSSCALFIVEYALARLLQERGIRPDALAGHSIGEYTAACLSGVLELEDAGCELTAESVQREQEAGFYNAFNLVKALDKLNWKTSAAIYFLSTDIQAVSGTENLCPGKATLLTAVKGIPLEYPHIRCYSIDFTGAETGQPPG